MKLLPTIDENNSIHDGSFIKALDYCKRNCNKGKCRLFYNALRNAGEIGLFTCPKGFSVCTDIQSNKFIIYTSFKENKTYTKKISNRELGQNIHSPILDEAQVKALISASETIEKFNSEITQKSAAIESISHEVKKLNGKIKERCENIFTTLKLDSDVELTQADLQKLREEVRSIFLSSSMIHTRYQMYEFEISGDQSLLGTRIPCTIYAKFDKIRRIFKNYLYKNIPLTMSGTSYDTIYAYVSFDMIPLLIIDNAIKYSLADNSVDIEFLKEVDALHIKVRSYSPYCSSYDCEHVFDKGFRGKYAQKTSDGSGLGLYFVKILCDLHNIDIRASSDNNTTVINNIPYSRFTIDLKVKLK